MIWDSVEPYIQTKSQELGETVGEYNMVLKDPTNIAALEFSQVVHSEIHE